MTGPLATVASSETFDVTSERTGEEYRIFVGFPASYGLDDRARFPAIYLLDGNAAFPVVTGLARTMQGARSMPHLGRGIPPAVIVGIGYPLEGDIWDASRIETAVQRRTKDYSGFISSDVEETIRTDLGIETETGGAEAFGGFVVDELLPLMEDRYRLDPDDRTIWGASLGGYFALYALFQRPGSFHRFAVTSPPLEEGQGELFDLEADYANQFDDLPAKVFLAIGEEEQPSQLSPDHYIGKEVSVWDFYRFAALLRERNYPSLEMATKVFADHHHTDVIAPFTAASLLWLFSD